MSFSTTPCLGLGIHPTSDSTANTSDFPLSQFDLGAVAVTAGSANACARAADRVGGTVASRAAALALLNILSDAIIIRCVLHEKASRTEARAVA